VNFIDLFIHRPTLTWVMTFALIIFGVLGYNKLGVDQFPDIEFPVVYVTATLEGASPEVMEQDVTDVLEEQLSTIEGIRSIRSTSANGASSIAVEFELGHDIDIGAQDCRDKVAAALRRLPSGMDPPSVIKTDFSDSAIIWIPVRSDRTLVETSEYVRRFLKPKFETIPGVASAELWGRRDRAIRLWVNGDEMRARGLAVTDILDAVHREHVELPSGMVQSVNIEYAVKTDAEFRSVGELERLIVSWDGEAPVRLGDVARVEDGSADMESIGHYNAIPAVALGIRKMSGANTVAVVDEVYRRVDMLRDQLPRGIEFVVNEDRTGTADFSRSIRESVHETIFALEIGGLLAVLTVFVFLRRTRPTMIVGAAIPLSLVATFGFMWMFGYTLNTMTLLAMTLAVGVVIDDAIVVLENIERHREQGEPARVAASRGTREIAFAATAATMSIAVVFAPVVFIEGITASFLAEFGGTVATSVMVSIFVALTLPPMLAARMPAPRPRAPGSIYERLERGFENMEQGYRVALHWALTHRTLTVGLALVSFLGALGFGSQLGREFYPRTDNGVLFVKFETPQGTRIETTGEFLEKNDRWMMTQKEVAGVFAGVGATSSGGRRRSPNTGMMFVMLTPKEERERSARELADATREALNQYPGQVVQAFDTMMMGSMYAFSFEIVGDAELEELDAVATEFIARMKALGGYVDMTKSLKLGLPEVRVVPDREKAAALGVSARNVARTIQATVGGMDIATFKEGGKRFDIRVRLEEEHRADPGAIDKLYVRGRDGQVIELRNVVAVSTGAGPSAITRSDRQRSVTVEGNLSGDKKLGDAMADAERIAAEILRDGLSLSMAGAAERMRDEIANIALAMALSIVVIYMVLAAQFESFVYPFTVMLALHFAMVGALGALYVADMTLNLFSLIGIVLLMGLVTKNSILLVDYANQLRERGMDKFEAMRTAAPIRMRPVLMTALSMIFGVLPAAIGVGPGAETRAPMAIAVAAGMLSSTVLTLILVPVFYLLLDDLVEWLRARVARRPSGVDPARALS